MTRLRFACTGIVVLSMGLAGAIPAGYAQSAAPTSIPGVLDICAPVVGEEYRGDRDRWGQCIAAVDGFLAGIGAPSEATDPVIVELVAELVKLYQEQYCPEEDTELPIAIEVAAQLSTEAVQQAQIIEISDTIRDCGVFATAALPPPPAASPS